MILIVSNNDDWSTNDVVEWIRSKGVPFERLNFDNFSSYTCEIIFEANKSYVHLGIGETEIRLNSEDLAVIWFRRSAKPVFFNTANLANSFFNRRLLETTDIESKYFYRSFFHAIGNNKKWLNDFTSSYNDKIETLLKAQALNIDIPVTFQTFTKSSAIKFLTKHPDVIMKPIYNIEMFNIEGLMYMPYTRKIRIEDLAFFDEQIFPVFLQTEIKKKYEIRSFFMDGSFYSMAIFSQQSNQTETDFRKYNYIKPNRRVPYQLPAEIEHKLRLLLDSLNLNSASIDLIKAVDGKYIFLEVNPVGQFGMVSYPCNYNLEEKIANFLIQAHEQ